MCSTLWRYRGFIVGMVKREFRARYLNSVLGSLWAILQPLGVITIYAVVFGALMQPRLPGVDDRMTYGIFLCAGVITWGMFTEVVTRCLHVFIEQANLLKKVSFPRATLPAIVVLSATLNFSIVFGLLLLFLGVAGRFPGWSIVALLPILVVQQSLALGLGMALGVLNVFFRDVAHAVAVLLQFWFWCTPIVYPQQILSVPLQRLLHLNPLTGIVMAYQQIVIRGGWPDWAQLPVPVLSAAVALTAGVMVFRRLSDEMVDYL